MKINTDKPVQIYPKLKTTSTPEILEICNREKVSLVDVAQDNAVEAGVADATRSLGIPTVGPGRKAGQVEWDKEFARDFNSEEGIPIPAYAAFSSAREGNKYLDTHPDISWAVKAVFLAEGKGVKKAKDNKEAKRKIRELRRQFPNSASIYLLEEWMQNDDGSPGEEFSAFFLSDGINRQFLGVAGDYKRAENFDMGENTGSMGSNAPTLVYSDTIKEQTEIIANKTISGLYRRGIPYKGVLYESCIKLIQNGKEVVKEIEKNSRWGDPEAEVIVPGYTTDFYELNMEAATGDVRRITIQTDGKARVAVTGASKGYPGNYEAVRGKEIIGIKEARKVEGVKFYSAAIKEENGKHYANGGRLFYMVGEGENVVEAQKKAYEAMSFISVEGNNLHFRTDIGWRDVQRLRQSRS